MRLLSRSWKISDRGCPWGFTDEREEMKIPSYSLSLPSCLNARCHLQSKALIIGRLFIGIRACSLPSLLSPLLRICFPRKQTEVVRRQVTVE